MKVLVLGAGVIGTTTAWYLLERGHEVTLVDRREAPGLETSYANGGQISASHPEPWAGPGAPAQILRWLPRDDAPLLFRLRMDPHQWAWGLAFLAECLPERARRNTAAIARISQYSRDALRELRQSTGIEYDALSLGILHFYTDARAFEGAVRTAAMLRELGVEREVKTVEEAVAIEPALGPSRERLAGATYMRGDESGDAHLFTSRLAELAIGRGARWLAGTTILRIEAQGSHVEGVRVRGPEGNEETLPADACVLALGSYSPLLARPLGIRLPIYPAKGYSATLPIADAAAAPRVSLTDEAAKVVFSRLGDRLRVAGTAELSGYSTALNAVRCEALVRRARAMFPHAAEYDRPVFWAGLRPSTPSNVPLVGRTRYPNLFLNTGHGTLGWTMACGSSRALADIISGRKPEVDFPFTEST